ncbi:DNA binding protein [Microbacterium phage Gshelby23]|nr:DNA binding protein [Microbacterium phage Gshelby23]
MPEKRKLTRNDIKTFDGAATSLILEMGEAGWTGHMTSDGAHVRMYSPDGLLQFTVSRNTYRKQAMANDRLAFERWRDAQPKKKPAQQNTKVQCPRPGCGKWYVDLDALNDHINVDHEGLFKCPDCHYAHKLKRAVALHRAQKHGYESPSKARRKELEAQRKQPQPETPEQAEPAWARAELLTQQIMDTAEILSIEPVTRRIDETVTMPAPVEFDPPIMPLPGNDMSWESIHLDDLGNMTLDTLLYVYQAAGLEMRVQVRKSV